MISAPGKRVFFGLHPAVLSGLCFCFVQQLFFPLVSAHCCEVTFEMEKVPVFFGERWAKVPEVIRLGWGRPSVQYLLLGFALSAKVKSLQCSVKSQASRKANSVGRENHCQLIGRSTSIFFSWNAALREENKIVETCFAKAECAEVQLRGTPLGRDITLIASYQSRLSKVDVLRDQQEFLSTKDWWNLPIQMF